VKAIDERAEKALSIATGADKLRHADQPFPHGRESGDHGDGGVLVLD